MYERHGTHFSSQGFYLKKNPEETTFFEKQTGFHDIFFAAGTSEPWLWVKMDRAKTLPLHWGKLYSQIKPVWPLVFRYLECLSTDSSAEQKWPQSVLITLL